MNVMRLLALAAFTVFLVGCGTICPAPGEPGFNNEKPCTYSLVVKKIDSAKGEVTAIVSPRVEGQKEEYKNKEYTFAVKDLKRIDENKAIAVGGEYLFFNAHNGPTLEVFPRESNPKP